MVFHRLVWFITVWYIVVQVGTYNFLVQVGFCTFGYTLVHCVLEQICTVRMVHCTVYSLVLSEWNFELLSHCIELPVYEQSNPVNVPLMKKNCDAW